MDNQEQFQPNNLKPSDNSNNVESKKSQNRLVMDYSKIGYNKPLYILAFDHRATFAKDMFNLESIDKLSVEEKHLIKEFKMLIYKGFKDALEKQIPSEDAAILCDE